MHKLNCSSRRVTANYRLWLICAAALSLSANAARAAFSADLQAQSFGNTNWISGHILGWAELDLIPARVTLAGGPVSNQTITVQFPHDGVQNLFSFTPSANVVITSGPTLIAPPNSINWSYTFKVKLTDNNPGFVEFRMRLSAGAHRYSGSSLQVDGSPGLSKLFIFKPAPKPGAPDLAIVKTGPASANSSAIIAYSISYSNRLSGSTATGVQIVDTLPDSVSFVDCSGGCQLVGNTVIWDLGDVPRGSHGVVTYRVAVTNIVTTGFNFNNNAVIAEAEDDANYADNASSVTTIVTSNCIPPSIVAAPADAAVCAGDSTTLSVLANGSASLGYQWRKDGVEIDGANTDTLSLNSLTATDSGNYDVVISNLCGSQTSAAAQLTVGGTVVTTQPANFVACDGESAAFTVVASGDALTYQWRQDGAVIDGATNALLEIASATGADAGNYDVVIGSACGSATSDVATLTFNVPVSMTSNPSDAVACEGDTVLLEATATGSGTLSYQWRKDGVEIAGATSSSYSTTEAGTYDVIVAGACNSSVTSSAATVTLNFAPAITQDPAGTTVCSGTPVTLTVAATGTSLTYQWRKNSADIAGANANSYNFAAEAGSYDVVVTGVCGLPVTSGAAIVTLKSTPVAVDDSFDAAEDTMVSGNVLDNDTDVDGDTLSASLVGGTTHGTLTLNADGGFSYTPNQNISGSDSFTYRAQDDCGSSGIATVTITIAVGNDTPVAANDSLEIAEDSGPHTVDVLANDSDLDSDPLTITGVTQGAHGFVMITGNTVSYTPSVNFNGNDSFTYAISDGQGGTASATVTVNVTPVNDAPVANNDSFDVAEDDTLTVAAPGVLVNDTDVEGGSLSASLTSGPAHGSLTLNGDGSFTYMPDDNFNGTDSFTYRVSDGSLQSAPATVTLNVLLVSGAGDIDLYVRRASAKLDWAHHMDTLALRGQINPRGMLDNLTGATLSLRINGTDVLLVRPLDAKGIAAGTFGGITIKARLKNTNGKYSIRLRGADLRSAFGMSNATGTGLDIFAVRLTVNGAGLEVPVMAAQLEGSYRSKVNKATALRFNFRRNRTLSGAFNSNRTAAGKSSHGDRVVTRGVVTAEDGGAIVPNGDLTVHIGSDVMMIPLAALKTTGAGATSLWQFTAPKGATGLVKFTLSNVTRSFQMSVAADSVGLPTAGHGSAMKHDLPLLIEVPTSGGTMFFESIIELKRSNEMSNRWKR